MARRTGLPAVEVLDACESTNDEALRRAHAGASHGAAVAAVRQTLGRGRRGHVWVSPPGGLYLSVVLRPGVARECLRAIPWPPAWARLTHAVRLARRRHD